MRSRSIWYFLTTGIVACTVAALLASVSSAAVSAYNLVYNFTGGNDGGNAATRLVFDANGNAYGTTVVGGAFGCGTVFKLHPFPGGFHETVLWNFSCFSDGKNPHGGVTLDSAGNIYGTTVAGGSGFCTGDGCGVVFKLQHNGMVILHDFSGGNDGFGPGGPIVFDSAGNIFGETPDGGLHGKGTVFELLRTGPNSWQHKILHSFSGGVDGAIGSLGPLLIDGHGNIFGVTEVGGTHSAGTVFELLRGLGGTFNFRAIFEFKGSPDAGFAYGGLINDTNSNLYGTTYFGGTAGQGTVYKLMPHGSTWSEHVLYSFKGGTDGSLPTSTLIFDSDRDLYGATSTGGRPSCDCGTIFKLDHITGMESVVHRFGAQKDGSYPYYGLTSNALGNLFSSTVSGGLYTQGVIFAFTP